MPARAATQSTGDNSFHGSQSGDGQDPDTADGSTIVKTAGPSGTAVTTQGSSAPGFDSPSRGAPRVRGRAGGSGSVAELSISSDDERGPLGPIEAIGPQTHFWEWRNAPLRTDGADDITAATDNIQAPLRRVRRETSPAEIAPDPATLTRATVLPTSGPIHLVRVSDNLDSVNRQVGAPSGPPGPVGPSVPAASAPELGATGPSTADAPPAVAPAPVATHPSVPAPVRRRLPLNGAETANMAMAATAMLLVGLGLIAFARTVGERSHHQVAFDRAIAE